MSSILKTEALIRSITRRAFIPTSQETFTDEDFLEMATEEINLGLVPLIQTMHEEHLVYYTEVPLVEGQLRYAIPARAHGNKLRDVALVDENGNIYEMHRYSINEISDFNNPTTYINNRGFYLENNDVVLSGFEIPGGYKLRMYFYMRPNTLVTEDRGATIQTINTGYEIDYITPASGSIASNTVAAASVITSANHGLNSGDFVSITGTNSTPVIDGLREVTVIDDNTFSVEVTTTVAGNAGAWQRYRNCKQLVLDAIPAAFSGQSLYDFVQHISPNKIIHYEVQINNTDQNTNVVSFTASDVPNIDVGDYITIEEESIVPNIPTELHPILAQRVAIACLEAMGDENNKQSAERKLAQMERNAGTFLDNRVEGASQKIKSRHSPLVNTLNTLGRRNRRW